MITLYIDPDNWHDAIIQESEAFRLSPPEYSTSVGNIIPNKFCIKAEVPNRLFLHLAQKGWLDTAIILGYAGTYLITISSPRLLEKELLSKLSALEGGWFVHPTGIIFFIGDGNFPQMIGMIGRFLQELGRPDLAELIQFEALQTILFS